MSVGVHLNGRPGFFQDQRCDPEIPPEKGRPREIDEEAFKAGKVVAGWIFEFDIPLFEFGVEERIAPFLARDRAGNRLIDFRLDETQGMTRPEVKKEANDQQRNQTQKDSNTDEDLSDPSCHDVLFLVAPKLIRTQVSACSFCCRL